MKKLSSHEIRETFLKFFESKGHKRMRSSSLVPIGDTTLLFTNAGMNQFKDVFLGNIERPAPSATTAQKCMRVGGKHNDLENVGRTARHHTFFEMLGNFSFGDYFKLEACRFAHELIVEKFGIDPEKLIYTVYEEDDEAFDIWVKEIGIDEAKVVRMGAKDNFWSMGDTGPCGPCSEIHVDQGEGPDGIWKADDIHSDSDRFLEIWNLVFMQYDRDKKGVMTPLPRPSVDTGGGLERFSAILQGVYTNYDTDLFRPIIEQTAKMIGTPYGENEENDTALRIIADHARATAFLIGDGMMPSNEFRGYVLRRIMRRAIRHGHRRGLNDIFMPDVCETVIKRMGEVYPELRTNRDFILNVVREEEKGFRRTLNTGLELLSEEIERMDAKEAKTLDGKVAFKLYDTYGFPVDLTEIIAAENGKTVDKKGFNEAMKAQKERGKKSWKGKDEEDKSALYAESLKILGADCEFTGYETEEGEAAVHAIIGGGKLLEEAVSGMDVELVFKTTPFYGESGGQMGDAGFLFTGELPNGSLMQNVEYAKAGQSLEFTGDKALVVIDTQKPLEGLIVHHARVLKGTVKKGDLLKQQVDGERRSKTKRNHSATHLLQYALRQILGGHVKQSGSHVAPDRLRFDFTHFKALTNEEILEIERLVNEKILTNAAVSTDVKSIDDAKQAGAIAIFGEKYGEIVRVVTMTEDSVELCGGTHVSRLGDIGLFKIQHESSIASGVRRIEAMTGEMALAHIQGELAALGELAGLLSVAPTATPEAVRALIEQQKADKKRIEQLLQEKAQMQSASLVESAEEINGMKVLCQLVEDVDPKAFRDYGQAVLDKLKSGVVFLASPAGGEKVNFLLGVSKDLQKRFPAGKTIGQAAKAAGGKGGGRPDMAQAGGGDRAKVEDAFEALRAMLQEG